MPIEASMCTRMPPTANDRSSADRSRSEAAEADASSPGSSTTANSSPPSRASESPGGNPPATHPPDRVAGPQRLVQPRADLGQDLVARVVAERVVELLEAVEVDQQQRDFAALLVDRVLEPSQEVAPVPEAGQIVRDRLAVA